MKILYLISVLVFLLFSGCKSDNGDYTPEIIKGNILAGKQINIKYNEAAKANYYSIGAGDKTVFEYRHSASQNIEITDDEYSESLAFELNLNEIPSGFNHFRYENDAIEGIKGFYQQSGGWVRGGTYKINKGSIEGTKISDTQWKVIVSILTTPIYPDEEPKVVSFEQVFEK